MNDNTLQTDKLDLPLIVVPGKLNWTARNAVEGVQIFGGIGSGKSSGSGRTLALKYLEAGYGGVVLTAKPTEKKEWEDYCKLSGRSKDLVIIEPGGKESFNFLEYETIQAGDGNALTENIVQVLKTVIRAGEVKAHGRGDDPFWESALDMLMFNVIDLCKLGNDGRVTVDDMFQIVQSLPKEGSAEHQSFLEEYGMSSTGDSLPDPKKEKYRLSAYQVAYLSAYNKLKELHNIWWESLPTDEMKNLLEDHEQANLRIAKEFPQMRLFKYIDNFIESYTELNSKTRSIIEFSFTGFLFRLLRDPIYSLFCSKPSTINPEDCAKGKIILLNLPVKLYHKLGRDCQILFKYIFQRAMEKRDVNHTTAPVFLWADEAQNFLHEHDPDFLATARSSRIATVYISQNIPNYRANMGGESSEHKVKAFLGTMATKLFHANADLETNKYASELIGDTYFRERSTTSTFSGGTSSSETDSLRIDKTIRPEEFSSLRTGGKDSDFCVDAIAHFQSNTVANKKNHVRLEFNQHYNA